MKYKKELLIISIYFLISLFIQQTTTNEAIKSIMSSINFLGIGFLATSILIMGIEDLINRLVNSGRLLPEMKTEKSLFTVYLFLFGFSSLMLYISENI